MKIPEGWERVFTNSEIKITIGDKDKWIEPEGPVAIAYENGTLYIRSKNLRIEVSNV